MFKKLFRKPAANKYPPEIYRKFYEQLENIYDGNNAVAVKIYEISSLLQEEEEEVSHPDDGKIPSPYWQLYYWVGNCFTALDPYSSHPLQPKDESYSSDKNRAAKELARTPEKLAAIKEYLEKRGAIKAKLISFELDRLEDMIDEKLIRLI